MYPFSNERLSWIEARIFLLGRMVNEMTARPARYQRRGVDASLHPQIMNAIFAEQLQLNLEKNCIEAYLEEQQPPTQAA